MILTFESLASYLGAPASMLLEEAPFKHWKFERTVERDLDEPLIDYVFYQDGVDFVCDHGDKLATILLYSDGSRFFTEGLQNFPFTLKRSEVIGRLGQPSKSGNKLTDPILGNTGPWDRFARRGYAVHIEYGFDVDRVFKITLMRSDVVPQ